MDRSACTMTTANLVTLTLFERLANSEWTPEITLRWLIYQYGLLMKKYLYTTKVPTRIFFTTSSRDRIAVLNRHTGPIIASSIDGAWGRSYTTSRLEMLQRQRGFLDDYYATMRQGIPISREEFVILERTSACKSYSIINLEKGY